MPNCCDCGKPTGSTHKNSRYCKPCKHTRRLNNAATWQRKARKKYPERFANRTRVRSKERATELKNLYGITVAQYDELAAAQDNACGICRRTEPGGDRLNWCVDHDHNTGRVRGLLCWHCNAALGKLGDSLEGLLRAVDYLKGT